MATALKHEAARRDTAVDDGETTETDSEREREHTTKRAVKREMKRESSVRVAAPPAEGSSSSTAAAVTTTAEIPTNGAAVPLPPGVAPNSILALMLAAPAAASEETEAPQPVLPPPSVPETTTTVVAGDPGSAPSNEYCALCTQQFKTRIKPPRRPNPDDISCACCQRTWLKDTDFSPTQRKRDARERRCRICTKGDQDILDILRRRSRVTREEQVAKNLRVILDKERETETRRAALAKRRLEREQQEELEEQERAARAQTEGSEQVVEDDEGSASDSSIDDEEAMRRMEKHVRDILTAIRSVHRRSQEMDLDGPDREAYEMRLLDEEAKLHEQAAGLCLQNPTLYDTACDKLLVIDGKVKLGERDHEQGDFDGDKPNHRVTKSGKTRVIRKKPDDSTMERGEALLRGAKATAEMRRQAQVAAGETAERPRKRVRRLDEDGIEMAVLNRPQRRVAKPASYVIDQHL